MKLTLEASAEARMIASVRASSGFEVGGILLGHFEDSDIVVTDVMSVESLNPSPHRYTRDADVANEYLARYKVTHPNDGVTGYIGEWHSHPIASRPSSIDRSSAKAIARETNAPSIVLVAAINPEAAFHAVQALPHRPWSRAVEVEVVRSGKAINVPEGSVDPDGPIFVSYRQSDGTPMADTVSRYARAGGLVVWRDHRDLRPGTTTDRLEQALTSGLSGAILVITGEIADSTIVREIEAPILVAIDSNPAFALSIANTIPNTEDPSRVDYTAPDRLLRFSGGELAGRKQSDTRKEVGVLEVVRDQVRHRVVQRRANISARGGIFRLDVQSRPEPTADDASDADLHIRLDPSTGRLPNADSVRALAATLSITSDAIHMARAETIAVSGGMHLSLALALGAALSETKFGNVVVVDSRGSAWGVDSQSERAVVEVKTSQLHAVTDPSARRIAVHVGLGSMNSGSAHERLVAALDVSDAYRIEIGAGARLDPRDADSVAEAVAAELKALSAAHDNAEVHLTFHGPFPLAVLLGRRLNTLQVIAYEWNEPSGETPASYVPCVRLISGNPGGPITEVLLT